MGEFTDKIATGESVCVDGGILAKGAWA